MSIRLINPRGRVVEVNDESKIPDLLGKGFLFPPDDQKALNYSQVHDRGPDIVSRRRPPKPQTMQIDKVGNILKTEEI